MSGAADYVGMTDQELEVAAELQTELERGRES